MLGTSIFGNTSATPASPSSAYVVATGPPDSEPAAAPLCPEAETVRTGRSALEHVRPSITSAAEKEGYVVRARRT